MNLDSAVNIGTSTISCIAGSVNFNFEIKKQPYFFQVFYILLSAAIVSYHHNNSTPSNASIKRLSLKSGNVISCGPRFSLIFHPDLIHGTTLGKHIQEYSFFGYQFSEALHLSERERKIVLDCFSKIEYELEHALDNHSKRLIVSNIELFLEYCTRFYDRQFITRDTVLKGILERFENLLNEYFQTDKPNTIGLPSVAFCANELHLSASYFGDLIKKETGKSAQEYIQSKIIEVAKERIFDTNKSVSEIAYTLGFKYPQHFSRLFKQKTGISPNEYRNLN